ncbi:MAG: UDP-N-acetylmuramoyl-tripeptide--D-alanyl-D-alanine ligase [Phycisphaerales bacterium]|nr:UDP-N-acetylmuramoyl-tripeptide--D-alanyl-D-alanine ligase [Phycisphaerales bacterium]
MSFWSLDRIKSLLAGTWLARPKDPAVAPLGVVIDSRLIKPGNVFIAMKGERVDGHAYLAAAHAAGAALAIVEDPSACGVLPPGLAVLKVDRSAAALIRLATEYRTTLEGTKVVAVSGSNGKTTTTRLLQGVLSARFRGVASQKSFNNSIGVPLTILAARPGDQFLICEVGTNAPGEIAELAEIVRPDISVITSIGREHLEGLGSLPGVIDEEAAIASSIQPGGVAIVPDTPAAIVESVRARMQAADHAQPNIVRFGADADTEWRVGHIDVDDSGTSFTINERAKFKTRLVGAHNAFNAAAVVAAARRFGMDDAAIAAALLEAGGAEFRLALEQHAGIALLNDAYNANPDSMLAGLRTFAALSHKRHPARRIVVLGDMLELGDAAPDAHREIGDAVAADASIDLAILVGPLMLFAAERLRKKWTGDKVVILPELSDDASAASVAAMLRAGDFVFLKGSRRMGLERISKALKGGADSRSIIGPSPTMALTAAPTPPPAAIHG